MIKLSIFQKEIIINFIIFIIGILLDIIGTFLSSLPINDICIGIGCSLIASSVVAFMSFLYREKTIDINNDVKDQMMMLYQENNIGNILSKIKEARSCIDICYTYSNFPYRLFVENNIKTLLSKGVLIRIILSDYTNDNYTYKKEEYTNIIMSIKEKYPNNIKLSIANKIIPFQWIRVDDSIIAKMNIYSGIKNKSSILEISKSGSNEIFKQYEMQFEQIWNESKHID